VLYHLSYSASPKGQFSFGGRERRAGCEWLTPVILATQKAEKGEIRRITV
jgi:hypothetical protein